jgi:Protein of unknown function (DUF3025)
MPPKKQACSHASGRAEGYASLVSRYEVPRSESLEVSPSGLCPSSLVAAVTREPALLAIGAPLAALLGRDLGSLDHGPALALDVARIDAALGPLAHVRFVPQEKKRKRKEPFVLADSYDGSITSRGEVPTRPDSLHDLMNALAWAAFPLSKKAIHARQFRALSSEVEEGQTRLPGKRSRLRDRLSMLDEGGVLVAARQEAMADEVEAALTAGDLSALRGELIARTLGHAITEHLVHGHIHRSPSAEGPSMDGEPIRACVVHLAISPALEGGEGVESALDRALSARVDALSDADLDLWLGRYPSIALPSLF